MRLCKNLTGGRMYRVSILRLLNGISLRICRYVGSAMACSASFLKAIIFLLILGEM